MVGMYNVVWAATGALAYFVGGAILETLGMKSLFYLPAAIILGELVLTFWLETKSTVHGPQSTVLSPKRGTSVERRVLAADDVSRITNHGLAAPKADEGGSRITSHASRITFQRLAWLANPFAYMAMNTIIAVIPGVAKRLELSAMLAGFCCSVWCFARLGAFIGLWYWDGWHYRFRWLLAAYLSVLATFAAIVLAPNLAVLVGAQILFGSAVGLIYYSSLFYSMDTSETKGTHGGIHEAAIGLGNFVGPAVGAAWLYFLPQYANSGAVAVSGLLLAGLGGLLWTWQRGAGNRNPKSEAQQQGDR